MTAKPIEVGLIEDDADYCETIREILSRSASCRLSSICSGYEEALRVLPELRPDVVLVDINLPVASGIDCVAKLKPLLLETNFLMLTVLEDSQSIYKALVAGATGYLLKCDRPAELIRLIEEIHAGGSPMSSSIARKVIKAFQKSGSIPGSVNSLSSREQEILEFLATGARYKEIAENFSLSEHTVRTHLHNIYRKLHVTSKTEAIERFKSQRGIG